MYNKKQRLAALTGVILLVLLYLVTLICAIFNFDGKGILFQTCLYATIALPILIWVYIWLFGKMTGKKTIADIDNVEDETENPETEQKDKTTSRSETVTISKRKSNSNKKETSK